MSKRPFPFLIADICGAIAKIERYTRGLSKDALFGDEKSVDAVVRNLEIIGEAANRLPPEFRREYPEIEWTKIIGLRHRIVHEYFGIDPEIIWQILQSDLPKFRDAVERIRRTLNP